MKRKSAEDKDGLLDMQNKAGEMRRGETALLSLPESRLQLFGIPDTQALAI